MTAPASAVTAEAVASVVADARPAMVARLIRVTGDWDLAEDCVQDAVERALTDVPRGSDITIHIHPDDTGLTPESVADLVPGCAVQVVPDPGVERGGCIVRIGDRTIDAQLGAALARVREVLAR